MFGARIKRRTGNGRATYRTSNRLLLEKPNEIKCPSTNVPPEILSVKYAGEYRGIKSPGTDERPIRARGEMSDGKLNAKSLVRTPKPPRPRPAHVFYGKFYSSLLRNVTRGGIVKKNPMETRFLQLAFFERAHGGPYGVLIIGKKK